MKIAETDLKLHIGLIIFAFAVFFTTFWDIQGYFVLPPSNFFLFGLIPHEPLVVQKLKVPHMIASVFSYYEPEPRRTRVWHNN